MSLATRRGCTGPFSRRFTAAIRSIARNHRRRITSVTANSVRWGERTDLMLSALIWVRSFGKNERLPRFDGKSSVVSHSCLIEGLLHREAS
jgi:hypothetical protein